MEYLKNYKNEKGEFKKEGSPFDGTKKEQETLQGRGIVSVDTETEEAKKAEEAKKVNN